MAKQTINIGSSANDGTGDVVRSAFDKTNDNTNEVYALFGDGSTLGITGDGTVSSGTLTIANDAIDYEKIDDEFSTVDALSAGATVAVDFDAAQVFTLTPNANTTLNITNPKIGITKTIIMTGSGGSRTLAFQVGGSSGTFNKIGGDYDDTSNKKNLISITCVGATEFWYAINQIAT